MKKHILRALIGLFVLVLLYFGIAFFVPFVMEVTESADGESLIVGSSQPYDRDDITRCLLKQFPDLTTTNDGYTIKRSNALYTMSANYHVYHDRNNINICFGHYTYTVTIRNRLVGPMTLLFKEPDGWRTEYNQIMESIEECYDRTRKRPSGQNEDKSIERRR